MKKIISTFLAAIMMFSMTGCGGKTTDEVRGESAAVSEEKTQLTFWGHQELSWNNSYQAIVDGFVKENPDIEIKLEFFPYDQYESKVQSSLMSDEEGADIYELWGGWGIDFAPTGALARIPEDMQEAIRADCYEPTIGALEYNGNLYGMPMEFNIESGAMLVNNHLLEENALEIPNDWDEMIADARKATMIEGNIHSIKGFDFVSWDNVTYLFLSMILSNGGQYLDGDGLVDFNTPEAKDAFEELHRLVVDEKVTDLEGITGGTDIEGYQQLFAGKCLFVPRGPWTIAEGVQTFELTYDQDFSYVPMPWYGEEPAFAAETGWALAVNGSSRKQEAAFRFINYMFRDDVLLQHDINCSMLPPKKTVANSQELLEKMPQAAALIPILDKAQFIGYFNTDRFKETINNGFADYCSGIYQSPEEALAAIQEKINESVK